MHQNHILEAKTVTAVDTFNSWFRITAKKYIINIFFSAEQTKLKDLHQYSEWNELMLPVFLEICDTGDGKQLQYVDMGLWSSQKYRSSGNKC